MDKKQGALFIAYIKDQLSNIYKDGNWVTQGIRDKLLALTPEKGTLLIPPFSHTIAQQLAHMGAWRDFVAAKLKGEEKEIEVNSSDDWPSGRDWGKVVTDFRQSQTAILEALDQFDPGRLQEVVPGRKYTFAFMIQGLIHHDYYHFGQASAMLSAMERVEA